MRKTLLQTAAGLGLLVSALIGTGCGSDGGSGSITKASSAETTAPGDETTGTDDTTDAPSSAREADVEALMENFPDVATMSLRGSDKQCVVETAARKLDDADFDAIGNIADASGSGDLRPFLDAQLKYVSAIDDCVDFAEKGDRAVDLQMRILDKLGEMYELDATQVECMGTSARAATSFLELAKAANGYGIATAVTDCLPLEARPYVMSVVLMPSLPTEQAHCVVDEMLAQVDAQTFMDQALEFYAMQSDDNTAFWDLFMTTAAATSCVS